MSPAELKQRLLIEWRKLDHLIVVATTSQWRVASPSLCLCRCSVEILSTFCDVFMVQCVKLMLRIFLIWGFIL